MKTKKRLVSVIVTSCVALCLCVALLAGSTFAWFTDTLVSSGNIIKAGNIDIDGTVYYEADSGTAEEGKVTVSVEDTSTTIYPIITKTAPAEGLSGTAIDGTGYYGYGEKTLTFDMGEGTGADLAMSGALVGGDGTLPVEPGESYARLIKLENTGTIDAVAKFRFYADGALGQYLWFDLIPVTYSEVDGVTITADEDYAFTPQDIDTFNGTSSEAIADEETGLYPHEYELKVKTEETEADTAWMVLLFGMITDADNSVAGLDVDLTMTIIATQTVGRGKNEESGVVADYPEWDGTNDLSWIPSGMDGYSYDGDSEAHGSHEGETYTIYTPQQLGGLAYYCNHNTHAFTNVTVRLGADMDLGNYEWTPIGLRHADAEENSTDGTGSWHGFYGDFDGDGHTIYNLSIQEKHEHSSQYTSGGEEEWENTATDGNTGLFGKLWGGEIENVTIHNANVKGYQCVGVLAGTADNGVSGSTYTGRTDGEYETDESGNIHTLISNCHVKGMIRVSGNKQVGGLIGYTYGVHMDGCSVEGVAGSYVKNEYADSSCDGRNVGGLVGFMGTVAASQFINYPEGYDYGSASGGTTSNADLAKGDVVPMTDCSVSGLEISGTRRVGGLVGSGQCMIDMSGCSVSNCDVKLVYNENVSLNEAGDGVHEEHLFVGAFIGLYQMTTNVSGTCTTKNVTVSYFEAWAAGAKAKIDGTETEIYNYRGRIDTGYGTQATTYTDGLFGGADGNTGFGGHGDVTCVGITETTSGTLNATYCPVTLIALDISKYI